VRDRLGQILFSDDTQAGWAGERYAIPAGQTFAARFFFLLPYLASGAYAIEAFVFEQEDDGFVLMEYHLHKEFLYVQSVHPSNGLANIAMRAVSLEIPSSPAQEQPTGPQDFAALHAAGTGR
jgi:hypothetical protein